jgi:IS30 family transposase
MHPIDDNITKSKISHLTEKERYKIEGYRALKMSNRKIAIALNKSHSTINAEIKRGLVKQLRSEAYRTVKGLRI